MATFIKNRNPPSPSFRAKTNSRTFSIHRNGYGADGWAGEEFAKLEK